MKRTAEDAVLVERLHRRLVDALERNRPVPGTPVTVAEIYQELVPFRTVRGEPGFETIEAYEGALLRLLAGEGDLAQLEPPQARDELRRELRSVHPNMSRYREYAGCDVAVTRSATLSVGHPDRSRAAAAPWYADVDEDGGPSDSSLPAAAAETPAAATFALVEPEARSIPEGVDAGAATAREEHVPVTPPALVVPETLETFHDELSIETAEQRVHCAFCDSALPTQRAVRFCPFCGADQAQRPCGACGEALQADWVFCVACGAATERGAWPLLDA